MRYFLPHLFSLLFCCCILFFESNAQNAFNCTNTYYPGCNGVTAILEQVPYNLVYPGCQIYEEPCLFENCEIGLGRYLSRAVSMEGLVDFIIEATCWGIYNPPPRNSSVNCTPPYDLCETRYCPDEYARSIEMLIKIKAQFILRTTTAWYREKFFQPAPFTEFNVWGRSRQLVCDINAAYDCANLRRPIIQAGIFESISAFSEFDGLIRIPPDVIALADAYNLFTPEERLDYFTGDTPRDDLTFERDEIIRDTDDTGNIDIRKIEARLWFLYQAKAYIDFGYKALHMGQHHVYGHHDTGFDKLYHLLKAIRGYADDIGSFVILNGENLEHEIAKWKDTDPPVLLFDFEARAMRPREVSTPQVPGDINGCDSPVDAFMFERTPCENEPYKAFIDQCVIQGGPENHLSSGGIHPLGCMVEQQPYLIYFDFGPGTAYRDTTINGTPCKTPALDDIGQAAISYPPTPWTKLAWGFDDQRWFGNELGPECREWWFNHFYCEQRNYHNGHGFIQIPGLLNIGKPENSCQAALNAQNMTQEPASSGKFLLADDQNLLTSISETLTPKPATMKITSHCDIANADCHFRCAGMTAPLGYLYKAWKTWYKFELGGDPDCSSTYSWQILDPDGEWLPLAFGPERNFCPKKVGVYKVFLRQDNYAFGPDVDPGRNGVIQQEEEIYVETVVCNCSLEPYENCQEAEQGLTSEKCSIPEKKINRTNARNLEIYPNPAKNQITLSYSFMKGQHYSVDLLDMLGRKISVHPLEVQASGNTFPLSLSSNLARGVYLIVLRIDGMPVEKGKIMIE
ncbi:MAG: T9SS type A sorting domain-containing protein [Lewinellaceae bacterium]|nr:T9SS type A sorting domain-containing protein [Phaeodactylibacter sp.]MCB9041336.1 T9SS type A sorting domain-containing protein [Lewinellaceae bacterium]